LFEQDQQFRFYGRYLLGQGLECLLQALQRQLTDDWLLLERFQRVANHYFLLQQLFVHLFELPTLDQHYFVRLPDFERLLLAITQQPLGIFAVTFAFAQVHLNEALDDERIQDCYLAILLM
jgi:hypothetical protein